MKNAPNGASFKQRLFHVTLYSYINNFRLPLLVCTNGLTVSLVLMATLLLIQYWLAQYFLDLFQRDLGHLIYGFNCHSALGHIVHQHCSLHFSAFCFAFFPTFFSPMYVIPLLVKFCDQHILYLRHTVSHICRVSDDPSSIEQLIFDNSLWLPGW